MRVFLVITFNDKLSMKYYNHIKIVLSAHIHIDTLTYIFIYCDVSWLRVQDLGANDPGSTN